MAAGNRGRAVKRLRAYSAHRPKVGDHVSVTLTGELIDYDPEMGYWKLRGIAPGVEHIEWTWLMHWATEFVLADKYVRPSSSQFPPSASLSPPEGEPVSKRAPMPEEYAPLAVYNAERGRGIAHTPEYAAEMAALKERFDQWYRDVNNWADDVIRVLDGERLDGKPL
jgi:hypothetical protein